MNGRMIASLAVMLGACVNVEPRRAEGEVADVEVAPDGVGGGDGEVGSVADGAADASDGADAGRPCEGDGACVDLTVGCFAGRCVDRVCVREVRARESCDDGNPCTEDGTCATDGQCVAGEVLDDGARCDADTFVCNGDAFCKAGECVAMPALACPASDNPCVSAVVCSEAEGGACVEVLREDGTPCGPEAVGAQCSRGVCVPRGMVFIAAGAFTMGCPAGDCSADNQPAHSVTLSSYAIDRTEVTEARYRACLEDDRPEKACKARDIGGAVDASATHPEWPATGLDWGRAKAVCEYEGKRLCSEAEWERAARGSGAVRPYPWGGADPSCALANFWTGSGGLGCDTGGPVEVGSLPDGASPEGLLDMAGNVAEWVGDAYRVDAYSQAGRDTRDPIETVDPTGQGRRVLRGGGWASSVAALRTYARLGVGEDDGVAVVDGDAASSERGVRCCLSLEQP